MTAQTAPAALTCTKNTSARSYSATRCGLLAIAALKTRHGYGEHEHEAFEPRCKRHANLEAKASIRNVIVDLTPEVLAAIRAEQEADAAVKAAQAAAKREERARAIAAATIEEQRISALRYHAISDPDSKIDWDARRGEDGMPASIAIPRWRIVGVDADQAARDLFDSTVALSEHLGEQRLEVRTSSRLTPNQARALVAALSAALNELG